MERVLDEDALRAAPIRFGLVTVEQRGLKPRELTLDEIPAGKVKDYLMAVSYTHLDVYKRQSLCSA